MLHPVLWQGQSPMQRSFEQGDWIPKIGSVSSAACIAYESGVACSVGVIYFVHDTGVDVVDT